MQANWSCWPLLVYQCIKMVLTSFVPYSSSKIELENNSIYKLMYFHLNTHCGLTGFVVNGVVLLTWWLTCWNLKIDMYLPSPSAGCDTRSIFKQNFRIQSFFLLPNLSYNFPITGRRIIEFITSPAVFVLCEKPLVSSWIWTRITVSIFYDDTHYTTSTAMESSQEWWLLFWTNPECLALFGFMAYRPL